MGGKEGAGFLFSMAGRFVTGKGKVVPLKADNKVVPSELHSMKSIRAVLELSPGQVLRADQTEN